MKPAGQAIMQGGSSPRVRGKLRRAVPMQSGLRIIPARAGQTSSSVSAMIVSPDHPRACGANLTGCIIICWRNGSSPRVRGKPELSQKRFGDLRIIPARAGQTASYPRPSNASADHPRACGANFPGHAMSSKSSGSSPRVRGKRRHSTLSHDSIRIIPARAGQTHADLR